MALEIQGKIVKIFPERSGEGNNGTWTSQDFMIEVPGSFPTKAAFDVFNKGVDLSTVKEGDSVRVSFDIRCNQWQDKYITSLRAWRLVNLSNPSANTSSTPESGAPQTNETAPF